MQMLGWTASVPRSLHLRVQGAEDGQLDDRQLRSREGQLQRHKHAMVPPASGVRRRIDARAPSRTPHPGMSFAFQAVLASALPFKAVLA